MIMVCLLLSCVTHEKCRSNLCWRRMFNLRCSALIRPLRPLLLLILMEQDESIFFPLAPLIIWELSALSASEKNDSYTFLCL